jgi:hypothetical protein
VDRRVERQSPDPSSRDPASRSVGAESKGEVKDWKWIQDPKVLLWIIGGLVFLIWVVLQRP